MILPKIINFESFAAKVASFNEAHPDNPHWDLQRWNYYQDVLDVVQRTNLINAQEVLEIGPMGIPVYCQSQTMDYAVPGAPCWPIGSPNYIHDAKLTPWPFKDSQFDLLIALRVFHHLHPFQREAFIEAQRVSSNVIIVVPFAYPNSPIGSKALSLQDFLAFGGNMNLLSYKRRRHGQLLFFSRSTTIEEI